MGKDDKKKEGDLEIKFNTAAADIKSSGIALDNDTLLTLYGYYKQAVEGDCTGDAPGFFDFKGKSKYDAWIQHKGMDKESAMKRYIKKVEKILDKKY
jgi:diazepam-binding inhibitor (GABA receptor modulating acyl-CoA-binding protein)